MKKNNKKIDRYRLIWILVITVLIMTILKIKYGYKDDGTNDLIPEVTTIPTPMITNTLISSPSGISNYNNYPLWQQLPYQGEGFVIDKYVAPKTLAVKVKGIDAQLAIKAVEEWLRGLGDVGKGHKIEIQN